MTVFDIRLHPGAVRFLRELDADTKDRIKLALRNLENDPFRDRPKADIKKLEGTKGRENLYRLRIGDYRAVYAVEGNTVWVAEIFLRGKGYRGI
ncbi:MAG: type II toxin-antitoxin system RelE/ParE family toxin [Candidatus Methanoperedens sp.]|nr:type II toxin-antitoxin system RelE/ParE family toxin [Candidatus Methanoperedens sp.]